MADKTKLQVDFWAGFKHHRATNRPPDSVCGCMEGLLPTFTYLSWEWYCVCVSLGLHCRAQLALHTNAVITSFGHRCCCFHCPAKVTVLLKDRIENLKVMDSRFAVDVFWFNNWSVFFELLLRVPLKLVGYETSYGPHLHVYVPKNMFLALT